MTGIRLNFAALTDVGRARAHNEDAVGFSEPPPPELYPRENCFYLQPPSPMVRAAKGAIFIVADGMGGHQAGEVASRMAINRIIQNYYADPDPNVQTALIRAVQAANAEIYAHAQASPAQSGMGTTVVAAVVKDSGEVQIAHVGDSRAYFVRGKQIKQITKDHSWVQEQVEAGVLTPEQARTHPQRNVITRALGSKPDVLVDSHQGKLDPGDVLVLCSDGLSGLVSDEEIRQVVTSQPPQQAAHTLVNMANERGGTDNISVVVLKALPAPAAIPERVIPKPAAPPRRFPSPVPIIVGVIIGMLALVAIAAGLWLVKPGQPKDIETPTATTVVSVTTPTTSAPVVVLTGTPTQAPATVTAPTATLVPTNTPTPSPTSTPTSSPTPTDTPTPLLLVAPQLVAPGDGFSQKSPLIILEWSWEGELQEDMGFDVLVWREGEEPHSVGVVEDREEYHKEDHWKYEYIVPSPGTYLWRIVVQKKRPDGTWGIPVSEESETRSFIIQPPPPETNTPTPTPAPPIGPTPLPTRP